MSYCLKLPIHVHNKGTIRGTCETSSDIGITLCYLLPDTTFVQINPTTDEFLVEYDLGVPLGHYLWHWCLAKETLRFTVLWSLRNRAASWGEMSHEPRVMPSQATSAPMRYSSIRCENGRKTKMAITRNVDSLWQNKWFNRLPGSIRSKRRLGQRQVWGQIYSVHPKGPSRRHSLRQRDL